MKRHWFRRFHSPPPPSRMPLPHSSRFLAAALAAGFLASCGGVSPPPDPTGAELRANTLDNAELLMSRAGHMRPEESETASVYQLRAAEIAWNHLDTDGGNIRDMRQLTKTQRQALGVIT